MISWEDGIEVVRTALHDAALATEVHRDAGFRAALRRDADEALRSSGLLSMRSRSQSPRELPASWSLRMRVGRTAA